MDRNVDYIIVGLGLAGVAFAEQLIKANKSFVVYENESQCSSIVAGGTYNPVILKRFTPVWNGHQQLELAIPFYESLAKKLAISIDTKLETRKIFSSIGDENNWFIASDKPSLSQYMKPNVVKEKLPTVYGDFGYGILNGTGRIDTGKLITAYKLYLDDLGVLIKASFNYNSISFEKNKVILPDYTAKQIVFCEGFGLKNNPFFNYLPLNGTKGETIIIHAPELEIDYLLKSTVFVLPLGDDRYLVGATFNWTDKTSIPTAAGKKELVDKLKKVIRVPFKVITQKAGIRPTVKDRRPLVGKHPKYRELAVLNGLGTRGVMIAPTVAENLFNHIETQQDLDPEIDIKRFEYLID